MDFFSEFHCQIFFSFLGNLEVIGVCGAIIVVLAASTVVLMCKLRNINTPHTARKDLGASPSINDSEAGQSIELSLRRTSHRLDSNETNMETNVQQNTATQRMNQQSQQTNTHQEQNYENVVAVSKDYMELKFAPVPRSLRKHTRVLKRMVRSVNLHRYHLPSPPFLGFNLHEVAIRRKCMKRFHWMREACQPTSVPPPPVRTLPGVQLAQSQWKCPMEV